jgi:uncharacterized protein YigA (DUF484 family)
VGQVISFENHTVARLRAAESARADLIAFAHGHSGAVAAIHQAVLAAMDAPSLDSLLHLVGAEWPAILGVDHVVLAVCLGEHGFRVDRDGPQMFARPIIHRAMSQCADVELRSVERGHALFGGSADAIRAEALIRIDNDAGAPHGLVALGQERGSPLDARHGADLLLFLGMSLAAMMRRWTSPAT